MNLNSKILCLYFDLFPEIHPLYIIKSKLFESTQGYNARKDCGCVRIKISSLMPEFIDKNRCISVCLVTGEVKSIKF